jgi:hypothetical protein
MNRWNRGVPAEAACKGEGCGIYEYKDISINNALIGTICFV